MLKHQSNVQGNEENSDRKRQYRNSQASIVEVGNGDEFRILPIYFFLWHKKMLGSVGRSETHILLFFWPNV